MYDLKNFSQITQYINLYNYVYVWNSKKFLKITIAYTDFNLIEYNVIITDTVFLCYPFSTN